MMHLIRITGMPPRALPIQIYQFVKMWITDECWVRDKRKKEQKDTFILELYSREDVDKFLDIITRKVVKINNTDYKVNGFVMKVCDEKFMQNPFRRKVMTKSLSNNNPVKPSSKCLPMTKVSSDSNFVRASGWKMPQFFDATQILFKEMLPLIKKIVQKQQNFFKEVFFRELRSRLIQFYAGLPSADVYELPASAAVQRYRETYDISTDEKFIIDTYNMVQLACWPGKDTVVCGLYVEEYDLDDESKINEKQEIVNCSENTNVGEISMGDDSETMDNENSSDEMQDYSNEMSI